MVTFVRIETVKTVLEILKKCDKNSYNALKDQLIEALEEGNTTFIESLYAVECDSSSKRFLYDEDGSSEVALDIAIDMIKNDKRGLQNSLEIMRILES